MAIVGISHPGFDHEQGCFGAGRVLGRADTLKLGQAMVGT